MQGKLFYTARCYTGAARDAVVLILPKELLHRGRKELIATIFNILLLAISTVIRKKEKAMQELFFCFNWSLKKLQISIQCSNYAGGWSVKPCLDSQC